MPARKKTRRKKRRPAPPNPELEEQIRRLRDLLALMSQSAGLAALGGRNPAMRLKPPAQSAGGGASVSVAS